LGALDKCSAYIQQVRSKEKHPVLVFDTGDFLPALPDSERSEYIIRGMRKAGYNIITVGDQEFLLGRSFIENHFALPDTIYPNPFTLASVFETFGYDLMGNLYAPAIVTNDNIFNKDTEKYLFHPKLLFLDSEIFTPSKIMGIIDTTAFLFFPQDQKGWFEVKPWRATLAKEFPPKHFNILLSHSGFTVDEEIAKQFPQIDIIIGGHSQTKLEQPVKVGKTLIAQAGGSGRYIGRMDLNIDEKGDIEKYQYQLLALTKDMPSDTVILSIVEEYEKAFFADKKPRPHIEVYPESLDIASANDCQDCHPQQYQQWSKTSHANAFNAIEKRRKIYNPGCISCHTTGFGHKQGFVDIEITPQWENISCTECHYYRNSHSENPRKNTPLKITEKTCIRCHTKGNSPDFIYRKYYDKIEH
jgi:2',3'-cyclic-nucleotide 2'-phosphodiesterase (5'-nucleotidase family)